MKSWLYAAAGRAMRRSTMFRLVVGTLPVFIDLADRALSGDFAAGDSMNKLPTYAVPNCVSSHVRVSPLNGEGKA